MYHLYHLNYLIYWKSEKYINYSVTHCPTDNRKSRDARARGENIGQIERVENVWEKILAASDRFHRVAKKEFRRERQVLSCLWKKNIDPMWFWWQCAYFSNSIFFFFWFSKVHWWLRLRLVSAPSLFHFHLHLIPKFVWSFYNNCGNISVCVGGAS